MQPIAVTLTGLMVAGLLATAPAAVHADTRTFEGRPGGPRGDHRVESVRVDNTGPHVSVTVRHGGADWTGRITIQLDFTGGPRADAVAAVSRGKHPRVRLTRSGEAWYCSGLSLTSRSSGRTTELSLPRTCADMAPTLGAKVVVDPRQGRSDRLRTSDVRQQRRPNIVMFVTDDMRADEMTYMPNVRSLLGTNGTTWTNSVSPYPLCCPARASIFSGQYTHNHRVYSHKDPYGFNAFDDRQTLATWLQDAGYRTALLGKYLNGYGDQPRRGRTSGRSVRYTPPGWNDWQGAITGGLANSRFDGGAYRYWDTTLSRNRGRGYKNLSMYQTYGYGKIEKRFVRQAARSSRPFFSYVGFTAPHHGTPRDPDDPGPVTRDDGQVQRFKSPAVPEPLRGTFDWVISAAPGADWHDPDPSDQPEEMQPGQINPPNAEERAAMTEITRQRAESLKAVDNTIADVLATLEATGELDRTYIIFTSDNGYFLGEQGIRQGKVLPYESALRTPLLIRGPGIPRGEVRTDPFSSVDFAPTILRMAGQSVPARVDGGSRLSVAKTGDRGWVRPVLVNTGPASVVRDTDDSARLLDTEDPGAPDKRYLLGVRTGRYLYTERASGFKELYDVLTDPNQYDNLIDDPAHHDVRVELRDELERIRSCEGSSCRVRLPPSLRMGP